MLDLIERRAINSPYAIEASAGCAFAATEIGRRGGGGQNLARDGRAEGLRKFCEKISIVRCTNAIFANGQAATDGQAVD